MASDLFAPKVVMETTMGAITMELYVKQAPKTCRNFLELSRRGYYDQVKFHRVIKDFMVQGGDPTGTGRGGESIYGPKFEDEVTRELKHTGAGIMSMGGSNLGTLSRSCEEGELKEAVEALDILVQQDFYVDNYLFYCVLKKCIENKDLVMGRRVHALALRCGYGSSSFVANHIIRMYGCHGLLEEAMHVFTQVTEPTCRMWASIILAHAEHGQAKLAIQLYRDMRKSTLKPNSYVFVAALKACAIAVDLESGKRVYADMCGTVAEHDLFVANCVVDMFSKCGSLQDARRVFDRLSTKDVVTWNVMIAGYAQQGLGQEALALYEDMQQQSITAANRITFVCLLQACASIGALQEGRQLHIEIEKKGLEADVFVGNSLVNLYAKCGNLDNARKVFDKMPTRDVVTWNAMIAGYVQQGLGQEALALYARMQQGGISWANHVTFVCLLQACASLGAVHQGKQLHAQIEEQGLEADVVVGNSLVDMYAKCGSLEDARRVFDMMSTRTVVTWTALLNGYAQHSDGQMAIECFKEMCQQGVKPDDTTYNCLLVACSHAGLVYEGQRYFKMMVDKHGIEPTDDLYNCLVDLLGRSGHLEEAENLLDSLPLEKHFVGWTSLLSACKTYGDMDRGRRCFGHLTSMEPQNASPYMLLASIYANAGMWGDLDRIERLRKSVCAEKKPAKACIEVKHKIHEFIVGDKASGMSSKLKNVCSMLKQEGGHVPHTDLVLKAVSEQDKEDTLCGHAEKLALAYGLLNTPEGTALLVTKNLRMCNDCHSSTKVMSRVEKREIVVRDSHRVHRFLDGYCSCGDRH